MPTTEPRPAAPPLSVNELAERFGFSPDELALNRAGQFSAQQRQTLFYRSWSYLMRGIVLSVISVGSTLMLARRVHTAGDRALLGVLIGLCAVVLALIGYNAYRVLRPTVQHVTGSLRRADDAWHPAIIVGTTPIRITTRRWRHLETTLPGLYRAYLDPVGRLLSIEPIYKD